MRQEPKRFSSVEKEAASQFKRSQGCFLREMAMTNPDEDQRSAMDDNFFDIESLHRQRVLGAQLRKMFDHVAQEEIPVDFFELLNRLDDRKRKWPS